MSGSEGPLVVDDGSTLSIQAEADAPNPLHTFLWITSFAGLIAGAGVAQALGWGSWIALPAIPSLIWLTLRLGREAAHHSVRFGPGTLTFVDASGASRTLSPEALTLSGEPGGPCTLMADGVLILTAKMSPLSTAEAWGPTPLHAAALRAAERVGVPLIDERPTGEWERWVRDPSYRRRRVWDQMVERDQRRAPAFYERGSRGSPDLIHSHHGYHLELPIPYAPTWEIDTTHIRCGSTRLALDSILAVHLRTTRLEIEGTMVLALHLLTDQGVVELIPGFWLETPDPIENTLRWLAHDLEGHAENARSVRESRGGIEQVPAALRRMVQPRRS